MLEKMPRNGYKRRDIGNVGAYPPDNGSYPTLLRPPEGSYSSKTVETAKSCGCDVVLWSVDTRDWALTKTSEMVSNVKNNVTDGSIILFHDFTRDGAHTLDALKILIPYLRDSGYEFVTVSQLLSGK